MLAGQRRRDEVESGAILDNWLHEHQMDGANIRRILLIAIVAIVAVLVVLSFLGRKPSLPAPQAPAGDNISAVATHGDVPENIAVPGPTSSAAQNVAKPVSTSPISRKGDEQLRVFEIKINNNKFSPDTVILNKGDLAKISFTAVDRDYDFKQPDYGLKQVIPKGQTKLVVYTFSNPGTFTFYCEQCGGPSRGPTGKIIVTNE